MIYILGGAARAGKSLISQKLLREHFVPYFSLDYLKVGIEKGIPSSGVIADAASDSVAQKLWPVAKAVASTMVDAQEKYLVEGDALLPSLVSELLRDEKYGKSIKACFVGYTETTPETKLEEIRKFAGNINDWIQSESDGYILKFAEGQIERSRRLKKECEEYNIPYFDSSTDFQGTAKKVIEYFANSPVKNPS